MTADPFEPRRWAGRLLVVGTGLIGTSVALAIRRAGGDVHLHDRDPQRVKLAESLGAGEACAADGSTGCSGFDVAVVAVPPQTVGQVCAELLRSAVADVVTHVSSIQTQPQDEVESLFSDLTQFVGGHPIAGREVAGPAGADAGLFVGRAWAVCPAPATAPAALDAVVGLVVATGATPVMLGAHEHDTILATVSHVPQLVASALAATLAGRADAATLAGPGFRDTTRLADSPARLWADIVPANASAVAAALAAVIEPLEGLRARLLSEDATAADAVNALLERGHAGRSLLPGKHGRPARIWASVLVVVSDEAGTLARLLAEIATAGVNVEDLRLEHAAGHPRGVVDLAVAPSDRDRLLSALAELGWSAVAGPESPL
jgi:prephenate dehydrogenase